MSLSSFTATISIESGSLPNPSPVHSINSRRAVPPRENDPPADLEMLPISAVKASPYEASGGKANLSSGSLNRADPHSSTRPLSHASEQIQTIWNPYKNRFRVLASCMTAFANGANDSAPGALIASIERDYNIAYGTVSIIFVCNALGFIAAAFFISTLSNRIGRAKTLVIGQVLLMLGYACIVITPPFPVVAASFFINGLGMATNLAIGQVFCSNLANNHAILGFYQGAYGMGGITAPLIATSLVSHGSKWSRFYIVLLCLAFSNLLFSPWAYWNYEKESSDQNIIPPPAEQHTPRSQASRTVMKKLHSLCTLLSNKPTLLGALFIFSYQGAEVAISGWIISFLVQFRNGDPSKIGYVTSGFWAGITLGRFTLSFVAHRIGERLFVFIVTAGALVLELLIWFVPSVVGDSVGVAFSGLLLGPVYACGVHIFQRLIPRNMQLSSLSLIASVGSSGGAVAPFMTGMLAQRVGTFVLHPICIGLFVAMAVTWWALPEPEKRDD